MKKIGEGWDYNVYDLNQNRVQKFQKTKFQLYWLLFKTFNIIPLIRALSGGNFWSNISSSINFVKNFLKDKPEISWFFGNPQFGDDNSYSQNKVIPLRKYLSRVSFQEQKEIIEKYFSSIEFMWKYRFSDTSFKFSKNYGVDEQGRVILIDLSNLTQDKMEVEKLLQNKLPLKVWVYRKMTNLKLKQYYKRIAEKELTTEKLQAIWN